MADQDAGAEDTPTSESQEGSQVSTEKTPDHSEQKETSRQDEEQKSSQGGNDDDSKKEKDEKKEKPSDNVFKHPAYQRQKRDLARTKATVEGLVKKSDEQMEVIKELLALQKGEEYEPSKKSDSELPDPDELLDGEMDALLQEEDLSPEVEDAVISIAKKYATDLGDGKKSYLPASTAYQIYKDTQTKEESKEEIEEDKEKKISTKPSGSARESAVKPGSESKKPRDLSSAVDRARRLLEQSLKNK